MPASRWLLFGGKGGVGKTTCAAAYAVDLGRADPARRVLLISTDPAHSLGDVFGAGSTTRVAARGRRAAESGGPRNRRGRELRRIPAALLGLVEDAFERVGGGPDAVVAMQQIMDLAPPGIDEVMAIADVADLVVDATATYGTIVSDTAPTGHVLRLLQTPAMLRDWTQALMAILLKYRDVVPAGTLASLLVQLSKRLRGLETRLHDPAQTRFVLVTRPAVLPREETRPPAIRARRSGHCRRRRHRQRRRRRNVPRVPPDARGRTLLRSQRCGGRSASRAQYAIIEAPAVMPPPHGARALSAWASTWQRLD